MTQIICRDHATVRIIELLTDECNVKILRFLSCYHLKPVKIIDALRFDQRIERPTGHTRTALSDRLPLRIYSSVSNDVHVALAFIGGSVRGKGQDESGRE